VQDFDHQMRTDPVRHFRFYRIETFRGCLILRATQARARGDADEVESIIPLHAGETDQKDSCAREAILCAQYRGAIHFERHGTP
jgi:hypothetical protein